MTRFTPSLPISPRSRTLLPFDRRVALHSAPPAPPGRWLILCDRSGVGESVAEALRARGEDAVRVSRLDPARPQHRQVPAEVVIDAHSEAEFTALVEAMDTPDRPLRGIIHIWCLDPVTLEAQQPLQSLARESGLLTVTNALERVGRTPRLWVVTRGALPAEVGEALPFQQLVWRFGRVLGVAHPELRPTMVELDPARPVNEGASALTRAVTASPRHRRLATRQRCWYAPADTASLAA